MKALQYTLAVALCAAMVGCSGATKSSTTASSAAAGAAAQASAVAAMPSIGAGHADNVTIAVYPGATKSTIQMPPSKYCGYNVATTLYQTGDSATKVDGWYQAQLPGGTNVSMPTQGTTHSFMLVSSDGADAAVVMQVAGAGKTQVALAKYDPPISSDDLHMLSHAHDANASDRAAMLAKMEAKCKSQ